MFLLRTNPYFVYSNKFFYVNHFLSNSTTKQQQQKNLWFPTILFQRISAGSYLQGIA